ncbi:serine hydrolase domain-containing protein [Brevundimonas sp.]|uniref:serine hydrolase domain-containing protein n=1 Tax=Brevundimonas sp. TaxID=1871086 RepID=UPI0035B16EA5
MRPFAPLAAAMMLAAPAAAQTDQQTAAPPDRHTLSLAAGYKAAFLCSGLFNAGLDRETVAEDDLTRIYVELRQPVQDLPAVIDREARTVSVAFAEDFPARVAVWRPHLGCVQAPPGGNADTLLPRVTVEGPDLAATDALPWPMGDAGAAPAAPPSPALSALVDSAFDRASFGEGSETTAVIVVKDGRIIAEQYRDGFGPHVSQRTWSVGKSLAASVIGAAVMDGIIDVDAPAPVPEWRRDGDPRGAITTEDLLHMASGLWTEGPGNRTDDVYFGGTLVAERSAGLPLEAEPGTRWRYANNDTLLAMRGLRAAMNDDDRYLAYPFQRVFWKIGMTRTVPETDWGGDFIFSSQVWTTARDLARLGLLYLNDGVWDGERVLPEGWADYVATPAPAQPSNAATGGAGYGAQFWLFGPDQDLPEGTYAAQGNRGQYLIIVPSRGVLIVRRGFDAVGPGGEGFDIARFSAEVLAALEE